MNNPLYPPFLRGNSSGVPMWINLRDSSPVRGEMFIEIAQPKISLPQNFAFFPLCPLRLCGEGFYSIQAKREN